MLLCYNKWLHAYAPGISPIPIPQQAQTLYAVAYINFTMIGRNLS